MRWRLALVGSVSLPLAFALTGCLGGDDESRELDWHKCKGGECATLEVPLDYDDPDGGSFEVALFRVRATDPDKRIGPLLWNFGGPGEPGISNLRIAAQVLSNKVTSRFDLIGFDPRGTGGSDPVECGLRGDHSVTRYLVPVTASERRATRKEIHRFYEACKRKLGRALGYIATVDTARDMDRIRAVLGEEQISYIGYSYGTYLGQAYANMFPTRVRAMVLDGVENAELKPIDAALAQAKAVEHALDAVLRKCARDPKCAFHMGGRSGAAFDALAARIEAKPMRVGKRELGPNEFWAGVVGPLYDDTEQVLTRGLASAARGDGKALLRSADRESGRRPNGSVPAAAQADQAINCLDGQAVGPPARFPQLAARFRAAAPRAGEYVLGSTWIDCNYWPPKPRPPQQPIRAQGAGPILVVGATGDPVTPYQNAVAVARQLDSGTLITNPGSDHTSNALLGGPCDAVVISFLVELAAPRQGGDCSNRG